MKNGPNPFWKGALHMIIYDNMNILNSLFAIDFVHSKIDKCGSKLGPLLQRRR